MPIDSSALQSDISEIHPSIDLSIHTIYNTMYTIYSRLCVILIGFWGSFCTVGSVSFFIGFLGSFCTVGSVLLGAKCRSTRSRGGTCAISASKDRAPISRLLKQSRDGAAPTHNDSYHTIVRYDWLYLFLG